MKTQIATCGHPHTRRDGTPWVGGLPRDLRSAACYACRQAALAALSQEELAARCAERAQRKADAAERYRKEAARQAAIEATWAGETAVRRAVYAELRRLGGARELTSESGSAYYVLPDGVRVRVADHAVPTTAERAHRADLGLRGCADIDLRLDGRGGALRSAEEIIADLRDELADGGAQ